MLPVAGTRTAPCLLDGRNNGLRCGSDMEPLRPARVTADEANVPRLDTHDLGQHGRGLLVRPSVDRWTRDPEPQLLTTCIDLHPRATRPGGDAHRHGGTTLPGRLDVLGEHLAQ